MPDGSIATLCMSGETYTLDTNILVYALDSSAGPRHVIAKDIVTRASTGPCILTLQAVSEFYAVTTRKRVMRPEEAGGLASAFLDLFRTVTTSVTAVKAALTEAASGRASYWDALLMATCADAGCAAILTEDLTDGGTLLGVRIINPFADATLSPSAAALLR
jgi:predicted nucleic acid-binding protein